MRVGAGLSTDPDPVTASAEAAEDARSRLGEAEILDNPTSGERFVFYETAADTGGELLAFELEVAPPVAASPARMSIRRRRSGSRW